MARHTVPPPTKELFIPATKGNESYASGDHSGYRIDADGETANIEFMAPADFHAIVNAHLVWIALSNVANEVMNIGSNYATSGEASNTHTDSTTVTRSTTAGRLYFDDISAALDVLAALDVVGITVQRPASGNTNAVILGVRLRYT